jgi:hypothetical protein
MRLAKILSLTAVATLWSASGLLAQAVDPNVAGPARRAIGGAAAAPGVQQRIERREERRDATRAAVGNVNAADRNNARTTNPDAWRMVRHNNQWWYYTPQNQWMYHNNNAWTNYDSQTYVGPTYSYDTRRGFMGRRYVSGYRGTYGPPATPYSNGTPAGNLGSTLGEGIGAAANGGNGARTGANIGGAIGNAIGAGNAAARGNAPVVNEAPAPNLAPVVTPANP